jgi:hypothetical protein
MSWTICACGEAYASRKITTCRRCGAGLQHDTKSTPIAVPRTDAERAAAIDAALRANRDAAGA